MTNPVVDPDDLICGSCGGNINPLTDECEVCDAEPEDDDEEDEDDEEIE